jgi:hypothetical protein
MKQSIDKKHTFDDRVQKILECIFSSCMWL